jgi:hypothetical protein
MTLVSTIPWAITVAWPRFTGAITWLVLLALFAATFPEARSHRGLDVVPTAASVMGGVLAATLYPPLLVGEPLAGPDRALGLVAVLLGAGAMAYAFLWIRQRDIPLEAAQ